MEVIVTVLWGGRSRWSRKGICGSKLCLEWRVYSAEEGISTDIRPSDHDVMIYTYFENTVFTFNNVDNINQIVTNNATLYLNHVDVDYTLLIKDFYDISH